MTKNVPSCCSVPFLQTLESEGRHYDCDFLPFMEIGSVAHKYYLINIRLPVNERKGINVGIGEIKDIRLVVSVRLAAVCPCQPLAEQLCPTVLRLVRAFPLGLLQLLSSFPLRFTAHVFLSIIDGSCLQIAFLSSPGMPSSTAPF